MRGSCTVQGSVKVRSYLITAVSQMAAAFGEFDKLVCQLTSHGCLNVEGPTFIDDFRRQHGISGETSKLGTSIHSLCTGPRQHCKATGHSPQELRCQHRGCHSRRTLQYIDSGMKRQQASLFEPGWHFRHFCWRRAPAA